ncbi:hypothetical protein CC1G_14593 [Coprinopsis cinerea okayama7|uniref:HBS1-like protein N-terminal domain-containing protein n=1 Tax=Coprinopsis cinerea (strain Okayama-7 / 130 / ATCC MYA-4618 / FGSC 9003) TaxID=240176 RepID=D6RMG7_COPC7|nr:hypothetical protein CC1G_14593 [Coprinopsis cinerea okayama7\|eukprot:XP_002911162.1 hypothetical protein CC1G_14593 [Coprinopsis cinerea okayama7\
MSRHRDVRNLDISAELDDDALSDGGDEIGDPQHQAQLDDSYEQVRRTLGDEVVAEVSERNIRAVLWDSYFDVDQTIAWCLDEYERKRVAKERKDGDYYQTNADPSADAQWSRVPKIMQAQPDGGYLTVDDYEPTRHRLSTIDEKTERTDTIRHSISSATTSYGVYQDPNRSIDPSTIPVSPPASAIQRLSLYEGPPPTRPSSSVRSETPVQRSLESVPNIDVIPDIPSRSKSSDLDAKPLPPKPSKLSLLASSRASAVSSRTESSRSTGTTVTGSVKTFPALRPSPQSIATPSAISRLLPTTPSGSTVMTPVDSETSALVNAAIQKALEGEALDNAGSSKGSSTPRPRTPRSPSPTKQSSQGGSSQRAPVPRPTEQPGTGKGLSKLALLAQKKVEGRGPKLPKTTTEYLTPIANGSSVTTAITTSYQSLYSLTDPTKSSVLPKLDLVPLSSSASPANQSPKVSKLAMKAKRGSERSHPPQEIYEEEYTLASDSLFQASLPHYRASPSSFASLLVDNPNTADKDSPQASSSSSKGRSEGTADSLNSHPNRRKHKHAAPPTPLRSSTPSFAFDVPSPDDIVMKARKGTSLARTSPSVSSAGGR